MHSEHTARTPFYVEVDGGGQYEDDTISAAACTDGTIEFLIIDSVNAECLPAFLSLTRDGAESFANEVLKLVRLSD